MTDKERKEFIKVLEEVSGSYSYKKAVEWVEKFEAMVDSRGFKRGMNAEKENLITRLNLIQD